MAAKAPITPYFTEPKGFSHPNRQLTSISSSQVLVLDLNLLTGSDKPEHSFSIHRYKMATDIELIRYQTKYRPDEHQNIAVQKPLVAISARMLELTHKILVQYEKQRWSRRKQERDRTHPDRGTGLPPE